MAKETVYRFDWKIKNLSCWCEAVHGKYIQSPDIFYSQALAEKAELYPRGRSGQDDHMELRLLEARCGIEAELSFIGSDGSLIFSQQVQTTQRDVVVLGPKFDEVIDKITKDLKDETTLQLRVQCDGNREEFACTTIGVSVVYLKIDPEFKERFQLVEPEIISNIRYSSDKNKGIYLKIARRDGRIILFMKPGNELESSVLLMLDMSIDKDDALVRKEGMRHVFVDKKAWEFSRLQESEEKGCTVFLNLKITDGEIIQRHNYSIHPDSMCVASKKLRFSKLKSSVTPVSPNPLREELMCLYKDQDFSDVTLKCGDVTFPVHKNILSARSPVFKAMFACDMQESASGQVDIKDLNPSTLGLFLTFLYTGAVGEEGLQGDSALNLYYAMDKYQVPSLKKECVDFLRVNVSISNVCDILSLGDKHRDNDLVAVSHNYILDNYNGVLESKEWERLVESEPMLAAKTLTKFACEKNVVKRSRDGSEHGCKKRRCF